MWYRLSIILTVIGLAGSLYFLWSFERVSNGTLIAESGSWPLAFPYPDRWLSALNVYFDRRYPVPPGTLKLHGELARVRLTVLAGFVVFATLSIAGGLSLARRWQRRRQMQQHGFPVLPSDPSATKRTRP